MILDRRCLGQLFLDTELISYFLPGYGLPNLHHVAGNNVATWFKNLGNSSTLQ